MQMAKIGIHGIIASSKTTMVEIMEKLGFSVIYELFAKNPYLEEYYRLLNMKNTWNSTAQPNHDVFSERLDSVALKTQLRFLHDRVFQYSEEPVKDVCDSSIYGDAAFAEVQVKMGIMKQDTYDNVYMPDNQLALLKITPMRLYLWLKCDPEWALSQIMERGRKMESGITLEYLTLLHNAYEKIYNSFASVLYSSKKNDFYNPPISCPDMIYTMDTTGKEYWNKRENKPGKDYIEMLEVINKITLAVFKTDCNVSMHSGRIALENSAPNSYVSSDSPWAKIK